MSPTQMLLLRQSAAALSARSVTGTIARAPIARIAPIASTPSAFIRYQSTSSAKGPTGAEAEAQGSDQRGKATTYALPVVAFSLVLFALFVRLSSKDSKQNAVNVGIGTDGASKLKGSKAKADADIKQSKSVDENIK